MDSYSDFYERKLYPLQDGVLNCVAGSGADFYLTGGTALNRGYDNRRFSEDLDFFLSGDAEFLTKVEMVMRALDRCGFRVAEPSDALKTVDYQTCTVFDLENPELTLKLDFVNDLPVRFGEIVPTPVYPRTDSIRNILSNKLTALSRFEAKDVADIHTICRIFPFSWRDLVEEARQKEAGFEAPMAAEILTGIPKDEFLSIRWVEPPNWETFQKDLMQIAADLVRGDSNSFNV